MPVLFVHGEDDPVVPVADARANAASLPQARLTTFPGDLHDVLNEHDRDVVHESVAAFVDASARLVADQILGAPAEIPPALSATRSGCR